MYKFFLLQQTACQFENYPLTLSYKHFHWQAAIKSKYKMGFIIYVFYIWQKVQFGIGHHFKNRQEISYFMPTKNQNNAMFKALESEI